MKRIVACGVGLLMISGAGICQAAPALQEGLWETTMETTMEGLPFAIPPTVVKTKQCLTKKDMIPRDENQKNCTLTHQKLSGNRASWEYECNQDGSKMTGKGEVTYTGSSSSGSTTTNIDSEGRKMTAITRFKGKRLGPCSGKEESTMEVNGQDVNQLKEQAEQAMEQKRELEAQMEATRQRSLALIEKIRIPAEKPDACEHRGVKAGMGEAAPAAAPAAAFDAAPASLKKAGARSECDEKLGALAIKAGEWEITTETTSNQTFTNEGKPEAKARAKNKSKAKAKEKPAAKEEEAKIFYFGVETETKKACLSPDAEPLVGSPMKRSANAVTWKSASSQEVGNITVKEEDEGGVEYHGDTFEGGKIHRRMQPGVHHTNYTRVTGKRLGDGNCLLRGREPSSKKIPAASENTDAPESAIENSKRKLKSLFGF